MDTLDDQNWSQSFRTFFGKQFSCGSEPKSTSGAVAGVNVHLDEL